MATYAAGFIPNLAEDFDQKYISNLANLEAGLSGETPMMGYDEKIGPFMYNKPQSLSGNLNEIISKDHPEGLQNAIKNSLKMQKNVGVMNKGSIPSFAATDQSFTQLESSFQESASALSTLAGNIQTLNSTLTNFETNFANINNVSTNVNTPVLQSQNTNGGQPNTNIGPFNVVLNQNQSDLSSQIDEALQNLKSEILKLAEIKVPPTTTPKRVSQTSNARE